MFCLLPLVLNWQCLSGFDGGSCRTSDSVCYVDQDARALLHPSQPVWPSAALQDDVRRAFCNLSGTSVSKLFLHFNLFSAVCTPAVFGEIHDEVMEIYKDK